METQNIDSMEMDCSNPDINCRVFTIEMDASWFGHDHLPFVAHKIDPSEFERKPKYKRLELVFSEEQNKSL